VDKGSPQLRERKLQVDNLESQTRKSTIPLNNIFFYNWLLTGQEKSQNRPQNFSQTPYSNDSEELNRASGSLFPISLTTPMPFPDEIVTPSYYDPAFHRSFFNPLVAYLSYYKP